MFRALFHPVLLGLALWDSWSHPETTLENTMWSMILHVLHFGATADLTRRVLAPLSFLVAHGVLAGWLVFTYLEPQLDRGNKVSKWGCTTNYALARTVAMHILPVVLNWLVVLQERAELQRLFGSESFISALNKHVLGKAVPWFVAYGMCGDGALGMPGFKLIPNLATQYELKQPNKEVEDLQTLVLIPTCVLAFLGWRVVTVADGKRKAA